jgi:chloramphenicol-sensitive protein RarD
VGLFPLYFRQIAAVPPLEVVLHRSAWSLLFLLGVLAALRRFGGLREVFAQPRRLGLFGISAMLLSCNWLLYVYAIQSGQVVEASLGYFINPIVNVLLGVLVLHERLNRAQWAAVALAAAGVLWLTLLNGRLPWIALVLAVSFGFYGLMRKTASLGALEGLTLDGHRRADQVVEGRQRGLGAVAGRDDDLLEGHRRRVAGGEHARHAGRARASTMISP